MKNVVRESVAAFTIQEFESLVGYGFKFVKGITLHRGVIVLWDEDYDARVLDIIDGLNNFVRDGLVAIHEHKGQCFMFWSTDVGDETKSTIEFEGSSDAVEHHILEGTEA